MYTALPKGEVPNLEKIFVHEDFESWSHEDYMTPMYVDEVGLSLLEEGIKPNQLVRYYLKDSECFVWQVIDKATALWVWDNYKQAGEPEVCILTPGPFDDYVDHVVDRRAELEYLTSNQTVAIALGYDK